MSNQPAIPRLDAHLAKRIAEKKATLDRLRPLPPEVVQRLHADTRVTMTYHSNAIEGNTLSLRETQMVIDCQVPHASKAGACVSKPESDQSQPEPKGYRATLGVNTTIGTVGWHLSPTLCGQALNSTTGVRQCAWQTNHPITVTRGTLPAQAEIRRSWQCRLSS